MTTAVLLGLLPLLSPGGFAAQAVLHVALVCIAAPLLAAGAAGSRFDPVRRWPHGFSPLALSLLQGAIVWAWHAPAAQVAVRSMPPLVWLQHGSVLLAGALLWLSVLGGERQTRYERAGAGIIALLLTSVHMTLLGGLSLIDPPMSMGAELGAGVDDRHIGALVTLAGAGVVYTIAGAMLLAWLLRAETGAERRVLPR